ncbi:SpoIIE family protein phosphatase, partial [Acinetobacter baumannii]
TGHGVGSALNTFRLHSFITSGAADAEDPAQWLQQLNEFLSSVLQVGQFATMFSAVIDFAANDIRYACASTPPPLFRTAQDGAFRLID